MKYSLKYRPVHWRSQPVYSVGDETWLVACFYSVSPLSFNPPAQTAQGKMAWRMKCLLLKHEDLGSGLQQSYKKPVHEHGFVISYLGETGCGVETCLAIWWAPGSVRELVSKNEVRAIQKDTWHLSPALWVSVCVQAHAHAHATGP